MNQDSLRTELEGLLSENIAEVVRRERTAFDVAAASHGDAIVLFGAGGLGKKSLSALRAAGIEPLAFTDNNAELWGTEISGVRVYSPSEAASEFGDKAAFVVTVWRAESTDTMGSRKQQLLDLGCTCVTTFGELFWKYPGSFAPHYAFDLPSKARAQAEEIRAAYDLWADEDSRREYLTQLRWRMLMDFDTLAAAVGHDMYLADDLFELTPDEFFVDCGAFDGDTINSVIRRLGSDLGGAVCFEPDPGNYRLLNDYVESLPADIGSKIITYKQAVGARSEKVYFDATGTASSAVGTGSVEVDCVTLDEALGGSDPTFIKMDIEGAELDALEGARRTIERCAPILAVSAYHRQDHLWKVPLLMRSMSDKYRFFLRPHQLEVWDLVCYAVPVDRLLR